MPPDGDVPTGPYQRPKESREQFLTRSKAYRPTLLFDTTAAHQRLQQRLEQATSTGRPGPRSSVYLWLPMWVAFPGIPIQWRTLDYRMPIPARAATTIWKSTSPATRDYNEYFDSWDVWFPPPPQPLNVAPANNLQPLASLLEGAEYTISDAFKNEDDFLDVKLLPSAIRITFDETYLQARFGLHPSRRLFPTVDYSSKEYIKMKKFIDKSFGTFGDRSVPKDLHDVYAAWLYAMLTTDWDNYQVSALPTAFQDCWDLDPRSPHFLGKSNLNDKICLLRARTRDGSMLYVISYREQFDLPVWHLVVQPIIAAYLLRRVSYLRDARTAVRHLVSVGAPFYTTIPQHALSHVYHGPNVHTLHYRPKDVRYTREEYNDEYRRYQQRVLDLLQTRPHTRAAFKMGGIIWRLVMEVIGDHDSLLIKTFDALIAGPYIDAATHAEILPSRYPHMDAYDNVLTEGELDIISGVYQVWSKFFHLIYDIYSRFVCFSPG